MFATLPFAAKGVSYPSGVIRLRRYLLRVICLKALLSCAVIMACGVIGCVARLLALRALVALRALLNCYLWLLVVYYWAWRYYLC